MAEGTEFEINIPVDDSQAASAADAVRLLGERLEQTSAVATAASQAVKAAESAYKASEIAADRAAKSQEKLGLAVDAQRTKLASVVDTHGSFSVAAQKAADKLALLEARQSEAAAKAASAKAKIEGEAAALDKLKGAAARAAEDVSKIGKAQKAASDNAKALSAAVEKSKPTGNLGKIGNELANFGGPLGAMAQKAFGAADAMGDLTEAMGSAGPYAAVAVAIVAIATAAATLTAAAIAGVAAITQWAVGLADVARTQRLIAAGVAGSVQGGEDLDRTIKNLTSRIPQTRDELLQLAAPLVKAGLAGRELADALEEAAVKAATAKFGPDFKKQMLSLPVQTERLKANFATLFSGLRIEKLLEGFKKLVDLFDETSVTGRAIKVVFESLFQPIIDGVVAFIPKMVSAFIQFEILVLKAMIAIKPFGSQIKEVATAFGILAVIVTAMTVGFVAGIIAPFAIIAALAVALIIAIREVAATFVNFFTELSNMSLADIGTSLIQGLINGITGGATAVINALTGVVQGGINAAKAALGIASPSKVFAEIGGFTAEGMAGGVDEGSGAVQSSMEDMVAPPAAAAGGGVAEAGGGGGITIEQLNVQAPAGSDPRAFAEALREALYNLRIQGGLSSA